MGIWNDQNAITPEKNIQHAVTLSTNNNKNNKMEKQKDLQSQSLSPCILLKTPFFWPCEARTWKLPFKHLDEKHKGSNKECIFCKTILHWCFIMWQQHSYCQNEQKNGSNLQNLSLSSNMGATKVRSGSWRCLFGFITQHQTRLLKGTREHPTRTKSREVFYHACPTKAF